MNLIHTLTYKIRCTWKGYFQKQAKNKVRQEIIRYYTSHPANDPETAEAVNHIRTHSLCTFPATFAEKYAPNRVNVLRDTGNGLLYVVHDGKKLYFKRSYNERTIRNLYCGLTMEQDNQSPHCYTSDTFIIGLNDVLLDIGSAEGIIPLTHIEKISHVVLFEKDTEWIEALEATFEPWMEKVTFINRYVSDRNDENNISIDQFLKTYPYHPSFIKIDVEGAEASVLQGMKSLLKQAHPLKVALCTYHQAGDYDSFTRQFSRKGYSIEPSAGFMLFLNDIKNMQPPYFRKGLIRITI